MVHSPLEETPASVGVGIPEHPLAIAPAPVCPLRPTRLDIYNNRAGQYWAGRLLFEILGTLAEFERTLISERTRDSLASKRERQEYTGGSPPYGLRLSCKKPLHMAPRKREKEVIATMLRLRSTGVSYQCITDHLNAEGIRPRRAKQWSKNTVRQIVQREERRRQSLAD